MHTQRKYILYGKFSDTDSVLKIFIIFCVNLVKLRYDDFWLILDALYFVTEGVIYSDCVFGLD
jgi:hypothetical protein